MVIYFEGKIGGYEPDCKQPMVNLAYFFDTDGNKLAIDRDLTSYRIEGDKLTMEWHGCYVWDGEKENYDVPALSKFISLEVEDDAPEGYWVQLDDVFVFDGATEVSIIDTKKGNRYENIVA